jgi:predicted membrane-bound spermidine synthase
MSQSIKGSSIETIINVGTGYFLAMGLNIWFLPYFAADIEAQHLGIAALIGLVYTGVSMARSFIFRRLFNKVDKLEKELSEEYDERN